MAKIIKNKINSSIPCSKNCGHRKCVEMRRIADSACLSCGDKIGYGTPYIEFEERLFHAKCLK